MATYIVKLYARDSVPGTMDYVVKDIVQAAIENKGSMFFYTHILNNLIETKFQQLEGAMNPNMVIDTIISNLGPYNVNVLKYEIHNLDDDTLDNGVIDSASNDNQTNIHTAIDGMIVIISAVMVIIAWYF